MTHFFESLTSSTMDDLLLVKLTQFTHFESIVGQDKDSNNESTLPSFFLTICRQVQWTHAILYASEETKLLVLCN